MKFNTHKDLKEAGFRGFVKIADLQDGGCSEIPTTQGVYMIVAPEGYSPKFIEVGSGGFYKGKNPNVSIEKLQQEWVCGTCCLYIGETSAGRGLRGRISAYMRFGEGKPVGHKGGRLIWQLADARDLLVCWKPLAEEYKTREVESELITEFHRQHNQMRPFANLKG